jgi:hypothetical protein
MAGMGQEERFPPTRLNAGYGFRKETIAGMRRNGRDAPIPRLPGFASLRGSDGSIHKKAHELHDSRNPFGRALALPDELLPGTALVVEGETRSAGRARLATMSSSSQD